MTIDALPAGPNALPSRSLDPGWHATPPLRWMVATAALSCLGACKQSLVVGDYICPVISMEGGSPPSKTDPISVPWASGFENQLDCDYKQMAGFCYGLPPASFRVVASPVHSGQFAGAFTVLTGTDAGDQGQVRCAREGVFPVQAYYGAWYYFPETATNTGLWNLFHFVGGSDYHGLWDVSLINGRTDAGPTGPLNLRVYGFLDNTVADGPPVPIGSWVHIELYWKRSKNTNGEIALYQNEVRVVSLKNLVTDDSGTGQGQWYVGNLATALRPSESTVYVDDVTISAAP